MSATCPEIARLPLHGRPRKYGGNNDKVCVYEFRIDRLPTSLVARQDQPDWPWHRLIEPVVACPYPDYEDSLHSTQPDWMIP